MNKAITTNTALNHPKQQTIVPGTRRHEKTKFPCEPGYAFDFE